MNNFDSGFNDGLGQGDFGDGANTGNRKIFSFH